MSHFYKLSVGHSDGCGMPPRSPSWIMDLCSSCCACAGRWLSAVSPSWALVQLQRADAPKVAHPSKATCIQGMINRGTWKPDCLLSTCDNPKWPSQIWNSLSGQLRLLSGLHCSLTSPVSFPSLLKGTLSSTTCRLNSVSRFCFSGNSAHNRDGQVYSLEIVFIYVCLSIMVPSLNKKILEDRSYQMAMIPADLFRALSPSIAINSGALFIDIWGR